MAAGPSQEVAITTHAQCQRAWPTPVDRRPGDHHRRSPEFPAGSSITSVAAGTDGARSDTGLPDMFGALPDLSEETADGPIPRISATGVTPFDAYAQPVGRSRGQRQAA